MTLAVAEVSVVDGAVLIEGNFIVAKETRSLVAVTVRKTHEVRSWGVIVGDDGFLVVLPGSI